MSDADQKITQSQKILAAASRCISTKGYANVSLRDVAEEAGVVLSQLNYYYKNKEGLFSEVIKTAKQEYLQLIEFNLKRSATIKEKVAFLVKFTQALIHNKPDLIRMIFDFYSMAIWCEPIKKQMQELFKEISDLIEKYISNDVSVNKILEGYSPKAIGKMLLAALFGIAMQYIIEPENENLLDGLNMIQALIE